MSKASKLAAKAAKRQQKAAANATAPVPSQPTAVVAPPTTPLAQVAPPKVAVPTIPAPKVVAAPVVAAPNLQPKEGTDTLIGVCVEVVNNRDNVPIFAKLHSDGTTYIAHRSSSTVPKEGDIVTFVPSIFEGRPAATVVLTTGSSDLILSRVKALQELPQYKTISRETYLSNSPEKASELLLKIRGVLSDGQLIVLK